jgi:hypothetical protein
MPRAVWPFLHGQPAIQVVLTLAGGNQQLVRNLLADTGAGSSASAFALLLDEDDCLLCGGIPHIPWSSAARTAAPTLST